MKNKFVWVCWYSESQIKIASNPTKALDLLSDFIEKFYGNKEITCELEEQCFNKWKQDALLELRKNFLENQNYFGVEDLCRACKETLI